MVAPPSPPPLAMPNSAREMMLMPGLVRFGALRPGLGSFGRYMYLVIAVRLGKFRQGNDAHACSEFGFRAESVGFRF